MHSALPKDELMRKLCVAGVRPASELREPAAAKVSWGIAEVDALTGGLPRGALTEVVGRVSSGRTSLLLAAIAQMSARGEVCALVDASDSFDPRSAAAAGINLDRLLWVRCGSTAARKAREMHSFPAPHSLFAAKRWSPGKTSNAKRETVLVEQALKATDLLLQGGGFGLLAVDLGDIAADAARRVPLTSWFRFRRAVEHTPTVLLVVEQEPYAKTCASLVIRASGIRQQVTGEADAPAHARVFAGIGVEIELMRSRVEESGRKPAQSARFASRVEWAG